MPKILLVDDNDDVRDMLAARLESRGYEVLAAADAEQAFALAQSEAPDVVLMDLTLPGTDGWQATRHLKSAETTRGIPVILLSAHVLTPSEIEQQHSGADGYEAKPVNFSQLLDKIQRLTGQGAA